MCLCRLLCILCLCISFPSPWLQSAVGVHACIWEAAARLFWTMALCRALYFWKHHFRALLSSEPLAPERARVFKFNKDFIRKRKSRTCSYLAFLNVSQSMYDIDGLMGIAFTISTSFQCLSVVVSWWVDACCVGSALVQREKSFWYCWCFVLLQRIAELKLVLCSLLLTEPPPHTHAHTHTHARWVVACIVHPVFGCPQSGRLLEAWWCCGAASVRGGQATQRLYQMTRLYPDLTHIRDE